MTRCSTPPLRSPSPLSPPLQDAKSSASASSKKGKKGDKEPLLPQQDLRYYARGFFCNPLIVNLDARPAKVRWESVRHIRPLISPSTHLAWCLQPPPWGSSPDGCTDIRRSSSRWLLLLCLQDILGKLRGFVWAMNGLFSSMLDYPVRKATGTEGATVWALLTCAS